MILVGDSLGMTILGYETRCPSRWRHDPPRAGGAARSADAWLIGDMPYMTYQPSVETAIRNAGRFMAEAAATLSSWRAGARWPTGWRASSPRASAQGHLGLTPQSASSLGGFRVQGKDAAPGRADRGRRATLEDAGRIRSCSRWCRTASAS